MQQYQTGISYRTHKEEEKLDTQANKQASKQTNEQTSKQTNEQTNEQTSKQRLQPQMEREKKLPRDYIIKKTTNYELLPKNPTDRPFNKCKEKKRWI